jgi:hypothetical protein
MTPMAVAALVVVATSDKEVVAAQVPQAARVEMLLRRQVVAEVAGCGAEVRCGSAEVVAAVLLSDYRTDSCAMRRMRSPD